MDSATTTLLGRALLGICGLTLIINQFLNTHWVGSWMYWLAVAGLLAGIGLLLLGHRGKGAKNTSRDGGSPEGSDR